MRYDLSFREGLRVFFKEKVSIDSTIGVSDKRIDAILDLSDPSAITIKLPTIFKNLKGKHLIEFKSYRDSIQKTLLPKIRGYTGFYLFQEQLNLATLGSALYAWLIVAGHKKSKNMLLEDGMFESVSQGIYTSRKIQGLYLMLIDELPLETLCVPFQVNGSVEYFVDFLWFCKNNNISLSADEKMFIRRRFHLDFNRVRKLVENEQTMEELGNYVDEEDIESLAAAVEFYGVKKVVDALGPEKVVDALGPEKVVDALGPEKVADKLDPETIVKILKKKISKQQLKKLLDELD